MLLVVNVGDEPIQATLDFDAARYDLPAGSLTLTRIGQDGPGEPEPVPRAFHGQSLRAAASLGVGARW